MASRSKVYFFHNKVKFALSGRSALKRYIESIFRKEGIRLKSLNYVFCNDKMLLQINRDYLGHDFYTDIVSFELSDPGAAVQGEIYISIPRVRENAKNHLVSFKSELHRVIFHGALHLCGYKDKTASDQSIMRNKEDSYLARYLD